MVSSMMSSPSVLSVNHPTNVYPALFGTGRSPYCWSYVIDFVLSDSLRKSPPVASNVTVYSLGVHRAVSVTSSALLIVYDPVKRFSLSSPHPSNVYPVLFSVCSVIVVEGSGKLNLTGNLGDVMKESVQAAMSYIRSRALRLHILEDFYKTKDIHVHFPEGAVPKDGPSAGITVCTAMVSALTGRPVRRDIAMTGEISIRGRVLPIGGLKEKTMAALRHGIRTVILPKANEKDLQEIDQTVRRALNFLLVEHVDAVIEAALDLPPEEPKELAQHKEERPIPVAHDAPKPKTGIRQ